MFRTTTIASLFALALVVVALGCSPEVPARPTYTRDVQPILAAHCVRCHDENLSGALDPLTGVVDKPLVCHLNRYEDNGASSGAGSVICAGMSVSYIALPDDAAKRMPPAPSDPLNDWEKDVLTRWATTTPPAP
jgi:hypothetical protein